MLSRGEVLLLYHHYTAYEDTLLRFKKQGKISRKSNFPECISENLCKFILENKYGWSVKWGKEKKVSGDLLCESKKIEVKCVNSTGPISFGPNSNWDYLYIIQHDKGKIKCWESSLRARSDEWNNLKVSRKETFGSQRSLGRRPRISFNKMKEQIQFDLIYEGNIYDILNDT